MIDRQHSLPQAKQKGFSAGRLHVATLMKRMAASSPGAYITRR